jgi:hypothetical protein
MGQLVVETAIIRRKRESREETQRTPNRPYRLIAVARWAAVGQLVVETAIIRRKRESREETQRNTKSAKRALLVHRIRAAGADRWINRGYGYHSM